MALFGAPISHEDHARRGVLAAWSLQRALKGAELGPPYGVGCRFRMGLNSGLVVGSIGDNLRMDYSAIGDTTNLASRLQQQAEPGDILIHETTARLVQGYIRLEALAPVEIRGKTEPVYMYQVIGTLPRRSPIASRSERTLSEFVGRERELAILAELFAQVEAGQGQVVGMVAEAGQGKSRLLYEFRQRLQGKRVTLSRRALPVVQRLYSLLSFTSINATGSTNNQTLTRIFTSINATGSHALLRLD
jgi:Adenylate and Guanylate cyclase catalytic domain/AAA ATPase domain